MKRIFLFTVTALFATAIYSQESYTFRFQESDFTVSRSGDTVRVESPIYDFNQTYEEGQPQLPLAPKRILNPSGKVVTDFTVSVAKRVIASDVILPAVEEPKYVGEVSDSPSVFIAANKSHLNAVGLMDGDGRHHGFSYSVWETAPFLYDANTRELMFVDSVTVSPVRTDAPAASAGSVEIKPRPDLMDWSDMENQAARATYQTVDLPNHPLGVTPGAEQIDYVIVTADSLRDAYTPLVKWKRLKGIRTKVVSIDSILELPCEYSRPQEKLKYYLYNLYRNNGLKWCMLGGDDKVIPVQHCFMQIDTIQPYYTNIPVDNYYACFEKDFCWNANGNDVYGEVALNRRPSDPDDNIDYTPEIHLARLPIRTKNHINSFIKKLLDYEINPNPDANMTKILMAGATVSKDEQQKGDSYEFMKQKALSVKNYAETDFLFDVYTNITNEGEISADALFRQIDIGYNVIGLYTHGDVKGYLTNPATREMYLREHASAQTNSLYSTIMAISCDTNEFDSTTEPCLSETLLRNPNGGAIAYLGWSRIAYISPAKELYGDFITQLFCQRPVNTSLGYVSDKLRVNQLGLLKSSIYDRWTLYGLNTMGDPEMNIYVGKIYDIGFNLTNNRFVVNYREDGDYGDEDINFFIEKLDGSNERLSGTMDLFFPDDYSYYFEYYLDLPNCAFNAMFSNSYTLPLGFIYRPGEVYILENTTIDYSQIIRADSVVIGENVTIIPNKTLTIIAKDNITIKSNMDCQKGASLKLKYE